jgi:hypothetical protein
MQLYVDCFTAPRYLPFLAALFVLASGLLSIYPVLYLIRGWIGDLLSLILFIGVANLVYAAGIDIALDPRLRKRRLRLFLTGVIGISSVSSLLTGAGIQLYLICKAPDAVLIAFISFVIVWQWIVETALIKVMYGTGLVIAFLLEMMLRTAATALTLIALSVIYRQIGELL